ncbi:MAG TPA: TerC/Alx family metal homeostasis membrane protein [Candidatus Acidoferrales bacterium]|nr:TerC/Alx family metal homeostasis membrane protein [Candidatus Acidoferrales bacterium]
MTSIATPALWAVFAGSFALLLALDLLVFHRRAHVVRTREAIGWSLVWIAAGLLFGALIYWQAGARHGVEFFTGYVIEESLSVDNLFVFILIFSYFGIPPGRQHRVLFWGVLGAVLFRAGFIAAGATLLAHFYWVMYIFGAFLVFTGIRLIRAKSEAHPESNPLFRLLRRFIPVTSAGADTDKFFVREAGVLLATPMLLALVLIEISDVLFAVDSVPAIFGVTPDPFIVFTSNMFAVLGLRAMYLVIRRFLARLKYLHFSLALILLFLGMKMLLARVWEISTLASLAVIAALLVASAAASLLVADRRPSV